MCDDAPSGTATSTLLVDDGTVRVTAWRFAARGDNTGWHRHAHDYVVVPLADGYLDVDAPDGSRSRVALERGVAYSRRAGVEHDVVSANDGAFAFVETELLETHE